MKNKLLDLKEAFEKSQLTIVELAKRSGLSPLTVSRYVKGNVGNIRESSYSTLMDVLKPYVNEDPTVISNVTTSHSQPTVVTNFTPTDSHLSINHQSQYYCDSSKYTCKNKQDTTNTQIHAASNSTYASTYDKTLRRGDVYYVKNPYATGSEMWGSRPALILSNEKLHESTGTVSVCYITSKQKAPYPTRVSITTNRANSIVLCEQIYTVSKERVENFLCHISDEEMKKVEHALMISLGMNHAPHETNRSYACTKNTSSTSTTDTEIAVMKAELQIYKKFYERTMQLDVSQMESSCLQS